MYLWGLLCKPGRDRLSPAPTLLSPPFPSPLPHHPQKATDSSMLIKSTSFSTQSDRLVPELDTIVPLESTKAYNMVDIVHAVSPTSVCLSVCWLGGVHVLVLWLSEEVQDPHALTAGTTDRAWGGTEPRRRGTCCGESQWLWPPYWLWPMEKGPCVQSLELRWVDFTHFCLGSHAQRAFCVSRERLIQPRQLCGDSLSQGLAPPGACSFSPVLWEASVSQQLTLLPVSLPAEHHVSPFLQHALLYLGLPHSAPRSCPVQLSLALSFPFFWSALRLLDTSFLTQLGLCHCARFGSLALFSLTPLPLCRMLVARPCS